MGPNKIKDLKCKKNHNLIMFRKQMFPKGGGRGGPTLGKKCRFFNLALREVVKKRLSFSQPN